MTGIGHIENVSLQYASLRCVYGWMRFDPAPVYLTLRMQNAIYLFKVVYDYRRPDIEAHTAPGRGFLAEIVYGTGGIMPRIVPLVHQQEAAAVAWNGGLSPLGALEIDPASLAIFQDLRDNRL